MNARGTNFKANTLSISSDNTATFNEVVHAPKTPIKRPPTEGQTCIFATLSPLPYPPKIDGRAGEHLFNAKNEMKLVETPLPKQKPQLLEYEGDYSLPYAIDNRIIFESSGENQQINSSQLDSSEELDQNGSNEENSRSEDEDSEDEESENEQMRQQGNPEADMTERKNKRSSKARGSNSSNRDNSGRKVVCNCKKTKCLKLYCDCFRLNQTCDGCNCVGCHNLDVYYEQRNNAIMALMDRNPDPFGQKIEDDKHVKGCNCKKSNCLKKYCECYQAGLKCGQNCKCEQCKNVTLEGGSSEGQKGGSKNTAKKQRKMVEI